MAQPSYHNVVINSHRELILIEKLKKKKKMHTFLLIEATGNLIKRISHFVFPWPNFF